MHTVSAAVGATGPYQLTLEELNMNRSSSYSAEEVDVEDYDLMEEEERAVAEDENRKRVCGKRGAGGGSPQASCQVENCREDLTAAKRYHLRHKVCEFHAKAPVVVVAGLRQRFCQQCSRFHELGEFDEAKRSCRARLVGHNERRRKSNWGEYTGEGSTQTHRATAGGLGFAANSSSFKTSRNSHSIG